MIQFYDIELAFRSSRKIELQLSLDTFFFPFCLHADNEYLYTYRDTTKFTLHKSFDHDIQIIRTPHTYDMKKPQRQTKNKRHPIEFNIILHKHHKNALY